MSVKRTIPPTPTLRLHKASGRAFVELNKQRIYLGTYDDPATQTAYHRMVGEWIENGRRLRVPQDKITVAEVIAEFLEHVQETGSATTRARTRVALEPVLRMYADVPAVSFGPLALRTVRRGWIDGDLGVSTINGYCGVIKLMFRWAASHEFVPGSIHTDLCKVPGVRRGQGQGKDPETREPAPLAHVEAVLPHLSRQLQAVVTIMLHCGARPTEVLQLRQGDLVTTDPEVWLARIQEHKTSGRGKERWLVLGAKCQAALRPFLLRPEGSYFFSPREAETERYSGCEVHRRPDQAPKPRKTDRTLGDHYDYAALNRAIRRVCEKHKIPRWTPYQLRHRAATTAAETGGISTASKVLGHAGLEITQNYVHGGLEVAKAWAREHG